MTHATPILVHDRVVTGLKHIGRRLDVSAREAARIVAARELRTFRTGSGPNARIKCRASEIHRYIREREARS